MAQRPNKEPIRSPLATGSQDAINPSQDVQNTVQQGGKKHWPQWPSSKPGPRMTQPPSGMRPFTSMRSEQMVEVGYDQELGLSPKATEES